MPGLAMTRSIGDTISNRAGVTSEPEIYEHSITNNDEFLVLGTDGIFEFMSNDEIGQIIEPFFISEDPQLAANELVREAHLRWKEANINHIDDITCIIIYFNLEK